ncbi:MerR family transcriptional regulator [Bailinhaonella thermotolerans]|uniref:MerR family transcriptional regulator n=1 Tax=Bailinhaonella thermotolerans TaxID=1070861 RepID=A0A3A4A9Q3_9ACTN|nr:MerR family transcriptional regulator [Bailinhaonella thermotolerans]RJL23054.1 MerR family transcriptional regulator [Bailinhaonella thermotolerans]
MSDLPRPAAPPEPSPAAPPACPSGLMTSGEFSVRSALSIKALRLYDANGLLRPALVDPRTGARRYGRDQLDLARRITALRALDLPLAQVARVLGLPARQAVAEVEEHWRRGEERRRAQRDLLAHVRRLLLGDDAPDPAFEVRERDVPEQRVISIQGHVTEDRLGAFITESSQALFAHLAEAGACLSGPPFTVFHGAVTRDSHGPVEVCLPTRSPIEPAGRIGLRLEPAHRQAYAELTRAQCAHPAILTAHDAVRGWLEDHGLAQCLPAREIYHPGWATAAPGDHAADVAFPFVPARDLHQNRGAR